MMGERRVDQGALFYEFSFDLAQRGKPQWSSTSTSGRPGRANERLGALDPPKGQVMAERQARGAVESAAEEALGHILLQVGSVPGRNGSLRRRRQRPPLSN